MKALLIAEKPSLMRTIKDVYHQHSNQIGMTIDFKAQAGHLLGLKMPDEINPVYKKWSLENLPLNVNFRYKVLNGKQNLIREIKEAVHSGAYDYIIHAGDPDQEGEILIRETLEYVGNRLPVKRFWSNDLTEDAVLAALLNLEDGSKYDNLAAAGYIRQHEDYLYGMNLTECMTLKSNALIRMGRVKAPIMKIIVDREEEIANFVPSSTYQRAFNYTEGANTYSFVDTSDTFDTKEALSASVPHIPTIAEVLNCKTEEKRGKAPKLYKLSSLQTDAYNRLRMPAATTLQVLQTLYEKKLVSYPRSSCEYISSAVDVRSIYGSLHGLVPELAQHQLTPRSASSIQADRAYCNDKAIAAEGHTGIIPTGKRPTSLSDAEQRLYDLVLRRFIAICLPAKQVEMTLITAKDENGYRYDCKGTRDIAPTFEYVLNPNYRAKQFDFHPEPHAVLNPVAFEPKEIEKKCPARFNEGSLIKFLSNPKDYKDEEGHTVKYSIGTEATRANIIEECIKTNYFQKDKGNFVPTDFGVVVCREYGDLDVFQMDTSAQWECTLESVRSGEADAQTTERDLTHILHGMIEDLKTRDVTKIGRSNTGSPAKAGSSRTAGASASTVIEKCPCCDNGNITETTKAYGCSNWNQDPKCDVVIWKQAFGANITKTDAKKLIQGKTIEKTLVLKSGTKYKKELAYDFDQRKVVWASNLQRTAEPVR